MIFRKHHQRLAMLSLIVAASVLAFARTGAVMNQEDESTSSWCAKSQVADNGPNDWVRLSHQSIHVVRASMQARAKDILARDKFVRVTDRDVIPYLRDGESVSQGRFIYLVRAAAFYVDENYELPKPAYRNLPFDASYSPSRDTLAIVNFALGHADINPTNLVLVIEAPNAIGGCEAVCLRTQ